ncbi:bifunctional indole-3-glycerol-phosphate synthase TrpC/phosphoribosylanthranilate isomerase TrpF [Sphingomicrobium lutaoense]|uniref:N-(5'-phosphoribosyl)anthranilate isomerase n=1 Tax=Sphingomicrobium lutaoense TaxID=515949 RepID=A0A839YX50_9SPHN|nr:bifunctional indole-3-glycerol-phosphate synthase TrpC/phosphoribosylanthranilate isomerase TrpF [Sphingomicrobium lutaoense]MBB3764771.1 indole-3-glycerol phosphate synthase/phosphoribosylanthranilate isomerase [Sphingomicrobium lutaoense]
MADVLDRIVARKRVEVADRLGGRAIDAPPTRRSLRAALARPGARFLMEIKPRSPSGHVAAHSPAAALEAYRPVADAISILTDEHDFGGSLELLRVLREKYDGPILAKDFIVSPLQVREARASGADAVLCMLSVLGDGEARAVMDEAAGLGMDVLVEVHDERESARALALGADLVGINNRDLKSLGTDLGVTERLAPCFPTSVCLLSESGIAGRADVARLAPLVDGFLVGSHLMAAPDIALAARSLVHGPVKICGHTCEEDVMAAARAGATHAGFILVPETPRALSLETAISLAATARNAGLKTVAVFRDAPTARVIESARQMQADAVQLHGSESQEEVAALREALPAGCEIWAAVAVEGATSLFRPGADRLLFDHGKGGTGTPFDWRHIAAHPGLSTAFIAGGIGPSNARAAAQVGAFGLDVGSKVEARPGRKDADALRALFHALRTPCRGDC